MISPSVTTSKPISPSRSLSILGHRGARGIAPENTMASFQAALDAAVDMIELDVHLSKDGHLVVMHDPDVSRTTDGHGRIGELTLAEIRQLDAAAKFQGAGDYDRQHIPTLGEVFDFVQDRVGINVEIKVATDGSRYASIEEMVVALLRNRNALQSTIVSSFDFATLERIHELAPYLARYAIVSTRHLKDPGAKRAEELVADLRAHAFTSVAVNREQLSEQVMALLKEAGLSVGVWVVNDVDEMWKFEGMGVDFMTTDRPDLLVPSYRRGRTTDQD